MKIVGLLYPVTGKTECRRQELLESGRVFFRWLDSVGSILGWKVYDYYDNNGTPPDTDVSCTVLFGSVSKTRIKQAHPPVFWTKEYTNNLDLVKNIVICLGGNNARVS